MKRYPGFIIWLFVSLPMAGKDAGDRFAELLENSPFGNTSSTGLSPVNQPTFEFCGYVMEGSTTLLSIRRVDLAGKYRSSWVRVGDVIGDYEVCSFDHPNQTVSIRYRKQIIPLHLKSGHVGTLASSNGNVVQAEAPVSDPDELLISLAEELHRRRTLRLAAAEMAAEAGRSL